MEFLIRDARTEDIDGICNLGRVDNVFKVSEKIRFYERRELEEWLSAPRDNILCVALRRDKVVGFFFCKIMSYHWAMLDNFYISPTARRNNLGRLMFEELIFRLKQRNIVYLTTLIEEGRESLERLLKQEGFKFSKAYSWFEYFL